MALVYFVKYVCKCENSLIGIKLFPYDHNIDHILAGFNRNGQANPIQGNVKIVIIFH